MTDLEAREYPREVEVLEEFLRTYIGKNDRGVLKRCG